MRKIWLENAIEKYIKNNPNQDSVDIVIYFKLRADITLRSLRQLIKDRKVVRKHLFGFRHGYTIVDKK